MNLNVLQIQALSTLIENVETMIELYWDTENGGKLSQSLQAFQTMFGGISQINHAKSSKARLVVDAHCPCRGFLNDDPQADRLLNISAAVEHARFHGHVVILNGTADLTPDQLLRPNLVACPG